VRSPRTVVTLSVVGIPILVSFLHFRGLSATGFMLTVMTDTAEVASTSDTAFDPGSGPLRQYRLG
jgi:hypothetical protein